MRKIFLASVLFLLPCLAEAKPLQFEPAGEVSSQAQPVSPSASDPLAWVAQKPATMMDLGLYALSQSAEKATKLLPDIGAVIAEYSPQKKQILLSFASQSVFSEPNCDFVVHKVRDLMFPAHGNEKLVGDLLQLPFMSVGDAPADLPPNLGATLAQSLVYVVYQQGGLCTLPVLGEKAAYWKDPSYKPDAALPESSVQNAAPAQKTEVSKPASAAKEPRSTVKSSP